MNFSHNDGIFYNIVRLFIKVFVNLIYNCTKLVLLSVLISYKILMRKCIKYDMIALNETWIIIQIYLIYFFIFCLYIYTTLCVFLEFFDIKLYITEI